MWQKDKQSQSSCEADDSESNLTLQGEPNTHAWNIHRLFRSNRLPFIPDRGQATTSDLQDRTHTNCAGHTSVARLQNPYSWLPCRTYSHRLVREKNQINRVVGGMPTCARRLVTRLTAYHISRYVVSTFKRLATTNTHFDLKAFIKTDRVIFRS
jgi:hypothetical protein